MEFIELTTSDKKLNLKNLIEKIDNDKKLTLLYKRMINIINKEEERKIKNEEKAKIKEEKAKLKELNKLNKVKKPRKPRTKKINNNVVEEVINNNLIEEEINNNIIEEVINDNIFIEEINNIIEPLLNDKEDNININYSLFKNDIVNKIDIIDIKINETIKPLIKLIENKENKNNIDKSLNYDDYNSDEDDNDDKINNYNNQIENNEENDKIYIDYEINKNENKLMKKFIKYELWKHNTYIILDIDIKFNVELVDENKKLINIKLEILTDIGEDRIRDINIKFNNDEKKYYFSFYCCIDEKYYNNVISLRNKKVNELLDNIFNEVVFKYNSKNINDDNILLIDINKNDKYKLDYFYNFQMNNNINFNNENEEEINKIKKVIFNINDDNIYNYKDIYNNDIKAKYKNNFKLIQGFYYQIVDIYNDYYLISRDNYEIFILNKYEILNNMNDDYNEYNRKMIDLILKIRKNNNINKTLMNEEHYNNTIEKLKQIENENKKNKFY
jgi:hypothetical protein